MQAERQNSVFPFSHLIDECREEYISIGIPLYEASIRCHWKAAKAILDENQNMVRCSITENLETPLHVAASAKVSPKKRKDFVKRLVGLMSSGDLKLQNKTHYTAFHLAAMAGNLETIKIIMHETTINSRTVLENGDLLSIAGGPKKDMPPLYVAVLFGHHEVANYLYKYSNLNDDCWSNQNRGWLLEKCIEYDMLDIAQKIVETDNERYIREHEGGYAHQVGDGVLDSYKLALRILASKPDAFFVKKPKRLWRIIKIICVSPIIKWVLVFFRLKENIPELENKALPLLKNIWGTISKMPKKDIDDILRGPRDLINKKDKSASGRVILEELIYGHLDTLNTEIQQIMNPQPPMEAEKFPQLKALVSKHLMKVHLETQEIIKQDDKQVSRLRKLISQQITILYLEKRVIVNSRSEMGEKVLRLLQIIEGYITEMRVAINFKDIYSSRILFIAAEMGNTIFLIELIRQYPDLIWKVNDKNQTIFHIAVKHRRKGIYSLLYEAGSMKDMITPLKDDHKNNMLHLVGKIAKKKRLQDVTGVALQMQQELLWFKEVESMIPPFYREIKNEDGLTPHELFTKEHKELRTQSEIWMKGTANQSMIVATLIATIVFAAAFTIPGGYNQTSGIPLSKSKVAFWIFVVSDVISLFSSSASILFFLSILTSRYAEHDFLQSLPRKLVLGLVTLFLSIATMTLAFSVSFFALYYRGLLWIPIVIAVFAVFPVLLYMYLQFRLFWDILRSTYGSTHHFHPKKHVLYYKNPNV